MVREEDRVVCLDDDEIVLLLEGKLAAGVQDGARRHLDGCEACRRLVALAARNDDGSDPGLRAAPILRSGARVSRHVILQCVGVGAMGVVYSAHDPELDRKVAIKMMWPSAARREQVLREAQAMARLRHPNVVAVHDVGMDGTQMFVVMEFVRGTTVGRWMTSAVRPWREVLDVFRQAGRGLSAAHAAGLVHRDFKPDNVLMDDAGRALVTDFGLARPADARGVRPADGLHIGRATGSFALGGGTPAYMAPEQLDGGPVDPRGDVYSFCVSLHEALYGARPFAGETVGELRQNMARGLLREAPRGTRVPMWLRRVVLRGLHTSPTERFESMDALLLALARRPTKTHARGLTAAVVGVVALLVAASSLLRASNRRDASPADAKLVGGRGTESELASTFVPPPIDNEPLRIALMLDAAKGLTRSGPTVMRWTDQSGNGNDAVAGPQPPTFVADAIHGFPAVHFDGNWMSVVDADSLHIGTRDFVVEVVARHDRPVSGLLQGYGLSIGYGMLYGKQEAPAPYRGVAMFVNYPQPSASTKLGVQTSYDHYVLSTSEGMNDNRPHLFTAERRRGTLEVRIDGVAESRNANAGDDVSAVGVPAYIGAHVEHGAIQQLRGDIAEIVVVTMHSDPGLVAKLEAELKSKFGLEAVAPP
jgi:serine/threonine protein kinase